MKKLLAYDLDGTLIDTGEDIARSINHMLRTMHRPELDRQEIDSYVGFGLHHLMGCCLKTDRRNEIEEAAVIYRDYYKKHLLDHSRPFPGAVEFLETYRGRIQVVITNKPNPFTQNMLEALGVASYFSKIIAGDQEYPRKPDPAAILAILSSEKVWPQDAVMIGDSLIDLEMGRRAGLTCAMLSHGFTKEETLRKANPDVVCKNFLELLYVAQTQKW